MRRMIGGLIVATAMTLGAGGLSAQVEIPENSPDTIRFEGVEMGSVTFVHSAHQDLTDCASCHHESQEAMPLESEYQSCRDCHTPEPTPPMTVSLRDAFHDQRANAGVCVDCHVQEKANGTDVPERCRDCHVRGG